VEDWNWSIFNHCAVQYWPAKQSNSVKKNAKLGLLRRSWSFKVIDFGINRKAVCDFLLVINNRRNWHLVGLPFRSYCSLLLKLWTLCVFEPLLRDVGTTYDVYLGLIEKRVLDFLLVLILIELFSLDVTAEALILVKIDWKSAISLQSGHFDPKFQAEGDVHHKSFLRDS